MQQEKKFEEVKPGKYEFFVKGVISTDKNGYDLKTQKGNSYSNLSIIVLDGNKTHSVFEPVFGKENLKGIVYAINNPALTFVYESTIKNKESFELENLIGESGMLLLGSRSYNDKIYPKIECFIKPKKYIDDLSFKIDSQKESSEEFKRELGEAEEVPF